jgi:hypothetical protein
VKGAWWKVCAAAAVMALVAVVSARQTRTPSPRTVKAEAEPTSSAVSPDRRWQVRVDGELASQRLLLTQLSSGDTVVIRDEPGITYRDVSFSPASDTVRFTVARANQPAVRYEIPRAGGAARRTADQGLLGAASAPPARGRDVAILARVLAILGTLSIALVLAYRVVRRASEKTPVSHLPEAKVLEPKLAESPASTTFTLWVRDANPAQAYLLALLIRVCRENPQDMPVALRAYADGERSRQLSYRTSPNREKGGTDVTWTLTDSRTTRTSSGSRSSEASPRDPPQAVSKGS